MKKEKYKERFLEDDLIARQDLEKLRRKKLGFFGRWKEDRRKKKSAWYELSKQMLRDNQH